MIEQSVEKINADGIKKAFCRRDEIKAQIAALKLEDEKIVNWLDYELVLNRTTGETQSFNFGDFRITARVPLNPHVDSEKLDKLFCENKATQQYAGCFTWKCETNSSWNKMPAQIREMFASAVTEKPGKTQYEYKEM